MILLLNLIARPCLAEPERLTGAISVGVDGHDPALHLAADYGVVRRVALTGEVGFNREGSSAGGGLLLLPVDDQWVRLGLALIPEVDDIAGAPHLAARAGLRAGWLMFWGVGVQGRLGVVADPSGPGRTASAELQAGFGISVRM